MEKVEENKGKQKEKKKTKHILTFTSSHVQTKKLSAKEQSPHFACQETQHQKGNHLFRVAPQAGGRAARHTITSWVPAAQCSSSPATTTGTSLASAPHSWDVLPRGHGSTKEPESDPKSPRSGSQDHDMEQKKGIM